MHSHSWTVLGGAVFFTVVVLFALGFPLRGSTGLELLVGVDVLGWTPLLALVGGPLLVVVGATVGMRYGNFERYATEYDRETGEGSGDSPLGRLHERVAKFDSPGSQGEAFVVGLHTAHVAVVSVVPSLLIVAYVALQAPGSVGWHFLALIVAATGVASVASFVLIERTFEESSAIEYPG